MDRERQTFFRVDFRIKLNCFRLLDNRKILVSVLTLCDHRPSIIGLWLYFTWLDIKKTSYFDPVFAFIDLLV